MTFILLRLAPKRRNAEEVLGGLRGQRGEKGEKGDKGDTGLQGIQGEKGAKGDTGPQGIQGPAGVGEVELVFTVMDMYKNGNTPISKFPNTLYPNASTPPNPASEGGAIAAWGLTLNSTTVQLM